jgi:enoyl-CoA hydratase/carnithine racemase
MTTDFTAVTYNVSDQIATITLNRPERMNSFSSELLSEWADAIRQATDDDDVRVVIVTGAGRAFCAGADLKAEAESDDKILMAEKNAGERRNSLRYSVHRVAQALQYLDKPYIAALNGAAVGAGMDMASMADIRIASDTARFGMSYVNVGLIPGDGGAWLLPRLVGLQKALELIWSGDLFDAQAALEMGYVARVVPHDDLMKETLAYARQLAEGPPIAMQLAKRLVYRGLDQSFVEGLEQAQAAMAIVQSTTDSREGPAAFRERRKPLFEGK